MHAVLGRDSFDRRSLELRRLVVLAVVIIAAAAAWHGIRSAVVRHFAQASVGCYSRGPLVGAALREQGFVLGPLDDMRADCVPRPGWITLYSAQVFGWSSDVRSRRSDVPVTFLDGRFRPAGKVAVGRHGPPRDIDGDGRWEIWVQPASMYDPASVRRDPRAIYAVIRLGVDHNELLWLGRTTTLNFVPGRWTNIRPSWEDTDGDGAREIVFTLLGSTRGPGGAPVFDPPEVIAVFKLDPASGLLRPVGPIDDAIEVWDPPDDGPVILEQDADLDAEFRKLLAPAPGR